MNILNSISILIFSLALASCGGTDKNKEASTNAYVVKGLPLHKSLHFTGIVQPLKETPLTSPMEAVLERMHFHYGQMIKKNETVFTLNSAELQKQYNDILTEYLKAKDNYTIAKAKFIGTKELWEAGLIAKNNFLSEKSSIDTSRVSFLESTRKLKELLSKTDDSNLEDLSSLSLSDFAKIRKLFSSKHNLIHLKASSEGVLLYPPKSDDKSGQITVGSALKSGQVLALIGDLTGISIEIDVPEVDIDKIHPGMKASISGVAFGTHQLTGQLISVNAQASNTNTSGLPSFTALIEVPRLTAQEQNLIRVGMSAAIELSVDSDNQLLVPIRAVKRENGNNYVKVQLAQGKTEKRIVATGCSQDESVVIESGLSIGDKVLYD